MKLKNLILALSLISLPAFAGPSEDAEDRLNEQLSAVASRDAAAFVRIMDEEAAFYAGLRPDDTAATAGRNVRTNIIFGIVMNIKENRLSKQDRVKAVMKIIRQAYRQKSFRGMEMIIDDIKNNRALYDKEIAAITDLNIRKLLNEDINAYLQPQND